jgi:hypothetical protein
MSSDSTKMRRPNQGSGAGGLYGDAREGGDFGGMEGGAQSSNKVNIYFMFFQD